MINLEQISQKIKDYYGDDYIATEVLANKYLLPTETSVEEMWSRIANAIASVDENPKNFSKEAYHWLKDFKFVPGGRINHAAGFENPGARLPTLSNCYFIPIEEDSTEAIMEWCKNAALVYRSGGGVGTDISVLRPKGAPVNASVGTAPGSVSFMNLLSEVTETIAQNGRRGALMITIRVDHPDVEDFIKIKSDTNTVKHANISVKLTDEFMNAVINDTNFDLRFGGKVYKTIRAKELWDKIIKQAHGHAEPGLMFWDHMTKDHNLEYGDQLSGTNPCGEIPLPSWDACNLAHINLYKFVNNGNFNFEEFKKAVRFGIRFLDNVITYNINRHALPIISKTVTENRRTGLGVTGLADMFIALKIKYDSQEALDFADNLFTVLRDEAYMASIDLAKIRGSFKKFDADKFLQAGFASRLPDVIKDGIRTNGIRNCTLLTVAPVGTGSIIAQTSSGIEPIYMYSYVRDVKTSDSRGEIKTYTVYHKAIKDLFDNDHNLPGYVRKAYDIDYNFRVKLQGVIQKYIDSSISSTINLPKETTIEEVANIYINAWKENLKGITVYRDGSREGVIRSIDEKPKIKKRPSILSGETIKIPINGTNSLYFTINGFEDNPDKPFEIFVNSNTLQERKADIDALMITLSALFRVLDKDKDAMFLMEKFMNMHDPSINAFMYDKEKEVGYHITSIPKAVALAYAMFLENRKAEKGEDIKESSPLDAFACSTCIG